MSTIQTPYPKHIKTEDEINNLNNQVNMLNDEISTSDGSPLMDCTEKWPEERDGLPWPPKMTMTDDVREKTLAVLKKIGLEHWDGSG